MKLCDLHSHSYFSDGTVSPAELIDLAQKQGLQALTLCDHNTVAGLPDFLAAAEGSGVEAVPAVELSTDYLGKELHILMLFVTPEDYGVITERVERLRVSKEESNRKLVAALAEDGIIIDYKALQKDAPDGYINRAHIAHELMRLEYAASVQEAFKTFLSPKGKYYTPPEKPDAFETIRFIKSRGAVAVLAHPYLNLQQQELEAFLPKALESGLDGMEVLYAKYDEETEKAAKETAERFGLLPSGGSDFHGENKPDIALGTGRGNLQIPLAFLDRLKEKKPQKIKKIAGFFQ